LVPSEYPFDDNDVGYFGIIAGHIARTNIKKMMFFKVAVFLVTISSFTCAFVPLIDGGTEIPKLYKSWFDDQIAKQAATAVQKAVAAGKTKIEVNFPPVPNVDEVKFGTSLNKKFGESVIAPGLKIQGGYKPGSNLSRNLIAYSNVYWAKKIAPSLAGGLLGSSVSVVSAELVNFKEIQSKGAIAEFGPLQLSRGATSKGGPLIAINPGGEETWDRIQATFGSASPFVVLNSAYSTTYGLGNKRGYEEAYYLKRISKGYIFRTFPGPWKAYLERPDGVCELLESYNTKPELNKVATLVRDESFRRFAINNDRWLPGFGERL